MTIKAPFPWFGGKSRVANIVWQRFGDVPNYVEPFYGSGAVHLLRPESHRKDGGMWPLETINDYDGFVANFWRSVQYDAEATAHYADWPVNENDLHARHYWLVQQRETLRARLEGSPEFYDAKIAGYWVWGICSWIGSGFASGAGPWHVVNRKLVHLGDKGRGINRQRVHLGNKGQGINRKRVHLGGQWSHVQGVNNKQTEGILEWFTALSERLRRVRVCSGDWTRVCGPTPTVKQGLTGVFLDPPYGEEAQRADLYRIESHTIAHDVREWCKEWGNDSRMRIALCGYDGEHHELENMGWSVHSWKAAGGYATQRKHGTNDNKHRELIWFSPHCLGELEALPLFARSTP